MNEYNDKEFILSDNLEVPESNYFIGNPKNKGNLHYCITKSICNSFKEIPEGMTVTLGGTGESSADTIAIRHSGIEMLPELGCANHEEADTRLVAHMIYNCRMFHRSRKVVHANDTDIILLCMYHYQQI